VYSYAGTMNEAPDFDERKLWHLIDVKEFKKAIVFLEDGSITTEHKTAAVNFKDGSNRTTLMRATYHHAEVKLIFLLPEGDLNYCCNRIKMATRHCTSPVRRVMGAVILKLL